MSYDPTHLTRQKDNKALAEKVKLELDNIKEDVSDLKSAMEKSGLTVLDGQFFIQPVESI
ncbi:MAG: hypothetical protein IJ926_03980 [Firmicutes bacterium]|nr:hypothetical protein [Bacillota bacterium]